MSLITKDQLFSQLCLYNATSIKIRRTGLKSSQAINRRRAQESGTPREGREAPSSWPMSCTTHLSHPAVPVLYPLNWWSTKKKKKNIDNDGMPYGDQMLFNMKLLCFNSSVQNCLKVN